MLYELNLLDVGQEVWKKLALEAFHVFLWEDSHTISLGKASPTTIEHALDGMIDIFLVPLRWKTVESPGC